MNDEIARYMKERDAALKALDVEWARRRFPYADTATLLLSLHKARYACTTIPAEYRHESGRWLRERGYHGVGSMPLLPEGQLPE